MAKVVDAPLPQWARPLLHERKRYKVLYGGRGSGKSWAVARSLVMLCDDGRPIRVLCARETQKSISESVHHLISEQIELLGLKDKFTIGEAYIRHNGNGSEITFAGLRQQGVANLKSYEGVNVCWVEEAQVVSKRSWDILTPTIRAPGSEIWVTFNPELDTDETYKRFVSNTPENCWVERVNWDANPWFPRVLDDERLSMQRRDPTGYKTVWEGQCRAAVEGAIYANEIEDAINNRRVTQVPYDPMLKVHAIWDLGWSDTMFIILVQRHVNSLLVIDVVEDSHRTYDWFSEELKLKRYNWGALWLPHDGFHANAQTGTTPAQMLTKLGWTLRRTPNKSVELGIKEARQTFGRIYFDSQKASRLVECLKRYRRHVPANTGEPSIPMHDEYSHGADAFRYLCLVAPLLGNEDLFAQKLKYDSKGIV